MTFPPGLWASTAAQVLLQGMEVTVTPRSLRWQIRSRYATLVLKGDNDIQSRFKDFVLLLPGLQIPRIHIQIAPGNKHAPGCLS